ncbi:MAG: helix-turn-helix domain-containing protein [Microbacterium sp.]
MREWIPISTSPKGRLALAAVKEFGARPFGDVTVGELAAAADVTTGAIYHHFGSKLGLYVFVRRDVERRLIDRMEGAAEFAGQNAVHAALQVGFDFATKQGFLHLLAQPPVGAEDDLLVEMLHRLLAPRKEPVGQVLAAGWRAALLAVAGGIPVNDARDALTALSY